MLHNWKKPKNSLRRNEFFGFFPIMCSYETKYMGSLSKLFWAAIEKGVCDIDTNGKLRKLNAGEKRQLLAILREHDDCPDGWKNKAPEKQKSILQSLRNAIEKLLNPEKEKAANDRNCKKRRENGKAKAANDRNHKRRRENGQQKAANDRKHKRRRENGQAQEYAKRIRENGQQKAANDKRSKATREANAQAILENKDHHEDTWDEDTLEKEAIDTVKYIVEKCGPGGFVHVFVGAWPKNLKEAVEAECFGRGKHAVFIDGGRRVHYHHVSEYVELFAPYSGTNCLNADELEKRVQKKLIDMEWPRHRRMFVHAGRGSCRGTRDAKIPFPYYTCVLICEQSMEDIGIRLATTKDRASRKRKRR